MGIEQKVASLNHYLRYHTRYAITIDLCALYGTISLKLTQDGVVVNIWRGQTLEKRLDEVARYLGLPLES